MTRTAWLAMCVALGACEMTSVEDQHQQLTLDPNPCTAVALTTPVQGFAALVGQTIALSASAACPAGATPEFQFWTKAPADANWTMDALGGYLPGGAVFSPSAIGDLCFSVAVRAIGSSDVYQARSSAACGSITGGILAPPPPTVTILGVDFKGTLTTDVRYDLQGLAFTLAPTTLIARLPMITGDRLTAVSAVLAGDDVVDAVVDVRKIGPGVSQSIGSIVAQNIQNTQVFIDVTDMTIGTNEAIVVLISSSDDQLAVRRVNYTHEPAVP